MKRRRALAALALAALALLLRHPMARAGKPWRVGLLYFQNESGFPQSFVRAMTKLGYVDGKDIEYTHRRTTGSFDAGLAQLAPLAAELVRSAPDAIVTDGTAATTALARATSLIPIVTNVGDPVGAGFAKSLARPGGNVTGTALATRETYEKTFEFLKLIIPGNWTLAIVVGDLTHHLQSIARAVEDGARRNGIPISRTSINFKSRGEVDRWFASMQGKGVRVVSTWTPLTGYPDDAEQALATKHGLVATPSVEAEVAKGALLAYDPSDEDMNERKASQLARILRGTPPGEIPFELPTKFRLTINLKTAKALGLTIPQDLLLRADKVYE